MRFCQGTGGLALLTDPSIGRETAVALKILPGVSVAASAGPVAARLDAGLASDHTAMLRIVQ
jgi:hypothetical protein